MGIVSEHPTSARSAGFTFLEVVIAMVIVGILGSALARFVDFDAANKAAADLGYQSVEARWKTIQVEKISDTVSSKSTAFPSLADLSGYAEASAPEEAPDTAPVLVDYSFRVRLYYGSNSFYTDLGYTASSGSIRTRNQSRWGDPDGDGASSCDEIVSGISLGNSSPKYFSTNGSSATVGWGVKGESLPDEVRVTASGASQDVSPSDPVPSCRVDSVKFYKWNNSNAGTPLIPFVWGEPFLGYVPPSFQWLSDSHLYESFFSLSPANVYVRNVAPNSYRYDCSSYSARYGVPYRTRGLPSSPTGLNSVETTPFLTLTSSQSLVASGAQVSQYFGGPYLPSTGNVYDLLPSSSPSPAATAVCERVGPAPAVPPATDGNPGNPPPKADFSGLCVAKGWFVATFKPDGTPTSSVSDAVARISSPTEDASCE